MSPLVSTTARHGVVGHPTRYRRAILSAGLAMLGSRFGLSRRLRAGPLAARPVSVASVHTHTRPSMRIVPPGGHT